MDCRIANTFTDSLAKLNGDEQKSVKTTAFDLQLNPATSRWATGESEANPRHPNLETVGD